MLNAAATVPLDTRLPIRATPYTWQEPHTLPLREWLYEQLLIRKFVTGTVAPGGVGKSSLIATEALAMVSGKPLLGKAVTGDLRVWLWNLEDPLEETTKKIQATAIRYRLDRNDIGLGDRLFVDSGRSQPLVIAHTRKDGTEIVSPVVDGLTAEIRRLRIDVIVIDPFVSCHWVGENDNSAIDMVVKAWGRVAERGNCAVHLVHHTRKQGLDVEIKTESARGGKAFSDACRVVRVLNRMSADEAARAGVDNHRLFFRAVNDKANLSPPAESADWYQLESISLRNGPGYAAGDSIGVAVAWQWPDVLAGITQADFAKAATLIRAGRWRESKQATDWVGKPVAEALGLDLAKTAGRTKVSAVVKSWIADGSLVVVDGHDKKGTLRRFVEVGDNESPKIGCGSGDDL